MEQTYKMERCGLEYTVNFADLQGSEKQVAWANDIRAQMVDGFMAEISGGTKDAERFAALYGKKIESLNRFVSWQTVAEWYIINRTRKDARDIAMLVEARDSHGYDSWKQYGINF